MRLLIGVLLGATLGALLRRLAAAALAVVVLGVAAGPIDRLGPLHVRGSGVVDRLRSIRLDGVSVDRISDRLSTALLPAEQVRIRRVVDGDTIAVLVDGKDQRVRVLGINTPEVYGGVQCGGPAASSAAKVWARRHRTVRLRRDSAAPDRDRYGRLLRYVEPVDGTRDLSTVQVAAGHARVAAYGQRLRKLDTLNAAQRRAKRDRRGLWGSCWR